MFSDAGLYFICDRNIPLKQKDSGDKDETIIIHFKSIYERTLIII